MTRAMRVAIPVALVSLAVAASGAASHAGDSARHATTLGPCPRYVQTIRRAPTGRNHARAFVPWNPIAAKLCVYSLLGKYGSVAVLKTSALLSAPEARTLTLLVDSRGRGSSCDAGFPVLVQLRYRSAAPSLQPPPAALPSCSRRKRAPRCSRPPRRWPSAGSWTLRSTPVVTSHASLTTSASHSQPLSLKHASVEVV
jgi:hypothetical protein